MDLASVWNILVVKLSSLGDIVHGTPCLRALRRQCPRARIVMAVERRWAPVVRHNPNMDELLGSDHRARGWFGRALEVRRLLARHVQPRFDLAIDLQGLPRSALWVYLSGARVQGGMGGCRPGWSVVRPRDTAGHSVLECAAHVVIQKMRPTSHHAFLSDRQRACMKAIDVDTVYQAVMRQLEISNRRVG